MNKLFLTFVVLFTIVSHRVSASESGIYLDFYKNGHISNSTSVHRSPMQIPVEAYYDDDFRQIRVVGNGLLEGRVFLRDEYGNTIAYSPVVNTTLDIPNDYSGTLIIEIVCSDVTFMGEIVL